MRRTIISLLLTGLLSTKLSAQTNYFYTVNQKNIVVSEHDSTHVTDVPLDHKDNIASFLKTLSLPELELLSEKFCCMQKDEVPQASHLKKNNDVICLYNGTKRKLTISNLLDVMEEAGVNNRLFVLAQSLLETGYYTSNACKHYNNLFGLTNPRTGKLYRFDSWESSVVGYKKYVQYKYKGGSYLSFLKRIGYAEDPKYISKVIRISRQLNKELNVAF